MRRSVTRPHTVPLPVWHRGFPVVLQRDRPRRPTRRPQARRPAEMRIPVVPKGSPARRVVTNRPPRPLRPSGARWRLSRLRVPLLGLRQCVPGDRTIGPAQARLRRVRRSAATAVWLRVLVPNLKWRSRFPRRRPRVQCSPRRCGHPGWRSRNRCGPEWRSPLLRCLDRRSRTRRRRSPRRCRPLWKRSPMRQRSPNWRSLFRRSLTRRRPLHRMADRYSPKAGRRLPQRMANRCGPERCGTLRRCNLNRCGRMRRRGPPLRQSRSRPSLLW